MKPIAIFYHALFFMNAPDNLLENAVNIVLGQMWQLSASGLLDAAKEFHVGLNGGEETRQMASLILPFKAQIVLHGLQCHTENRTILMLERWLPAHRDWYVLYFHAKGATHPAGHELSTRWRECMTRCVIMNWRNCIRDLDVGFEAVGCHWMVPPATPPGQHIFAGTFFWAKTSFLTTLPSILARPAIKLSGLDSIESRYETEVWIGNGRRLPRVLDYHPGHPYAVHNKINP